MPMSTTNPFFAPSELPFGAPPFDRIRDEHYQPAIEEGMRQHLAEVRAIAGQAAAPTFDNTIVALERSGALLTRALRAFAAVTGANTNDALQQVQINVAPKLAAHSDSIYLDEKLFRRVRVLYEQRDQLNLSPEEKYLIERYHLDFERSGALLSDAHKTRLRALNEEESTLTTDFQNRLLAATKANGLVLDDAGQLEGLSEADIAAAAEAALERKLSGRWLLTLQNTTQQPWQDGQHQVGRRPGRDDRRARLQRLGIEGAMAFRRGDRTFALVQHLHVATQRKRADDEFGVLPVLLVFRLPAVQRVAEADGKAQHLHAAGHRHAVVAVFVHGDQQGKGDDEGNDGQHVGRVPGLRPSGSNVRQRGCRVKPGMTIKFARHDNRKFKRGMTNDPLPRWL